MSSLWNTLVICFQLQILSLFQGLRQSKEVLANLQTSNTLLDISK